MAGKLMGSITVVNDGGGLVTDISASQLVDVPRDEQVTIACDGHKTIGIFDSDHDQPAMTFLAVINSDGMLELTLVGESAESFLGIKPGSAVVVSWT